LVAVDEVVLQIVISQQLPFSLAMADEGAGDHKESGVGVDEDDEEIARTPQFKSKVSTRMRSSACQT
jgi:hypothetical protein